MQWLAPNDESCSFRPFGEIHQVGGFGDHQVRYLIAILGNALVPTALIISDFRDSAVDLFVGLGSHGEFDVSRPASVNKALSASRSEEHTSELQSLRHLVCRLLLE